MTLKIGPSRNVSRDMKDYLPKYYDESKITQAMIDADSVEVEALKKEIEDVLNQFFIDKATWGLERWETIVGIETDLTLSAENRKSKIKAKLRGFGTVTVAKLESIADSFYESTVEESPASYEITVTLKGVHGQPSNFEDFKQAVEDIIPAHLKTIYVFTYLTWGELDGAELTWADVERYTIDELYETTF